MADIEMDKIKAIINLKVVLPVLKEMEAFDRASGGKGSGKAAGDIVIEVTGQPDLAVTIRFKGDGIEVLNNKVDKPKVTLTFSSIAALNDSIGGGKSKPKIKGLLFGIILLLKFKHLSKLLGASIKGEGPLGEAKTRAALLLKVIVYAIAALSAEHPVIKGAVDGMEGVAMFGIAADNLYYHLVFNKGNVTAYNSTHPKPNAVIKWPDAETTVGVLTKTKQAKMDMSGDFGFAVKTASIMGKTGEILKQAKES